MPTLQNINNYISNTTIHKIPSITSTAMEQQLTHLEGHANILKKKLLETPQANPRRPSKQYKTMKGELTSINKQIKQITKDLKKVDAIKNTALNIGQDHGIINLHGTDIHW